MWVAQSRIRVGGAQHKDTTSTGSDSRVVSWDDASDIASAAVGGVTRLNIPQQAPVRSHKVACAWVELQIKGMAMTHGISRGLFRGVSRLRRMGMSCVLSCRAPQPRPSIRHAPRMPTRCSIPLAGVHKPACARVERHTTKGTDSQVLSRSCRSRCRRARWNWKSSLLQLACCRRARSY